MGFNFNEFLKKQKQVSGKLKFNQFANTTKVNRYPLLFKRTKEVVGECEKILSFGCSTGEEVETLKKLYFKKSEVCGYDLNSEAIGIAKNRYNYMFFSQYKEVSRHRFNLIFCCSVLCQFPNWSDYSFERFEETLLYVDNLLEVEGYLVIYNSSFDFEDTEIFKKKYKVIQIKKEKLFNKAMVPLREKDQTVKKSKPSIIFKKVKE